MTDIDTDFRDGATEVHVDARPRQGRGQRRHVQDIADTVNNRHRRACARGKYTNGIRRYDVRMRLLPSQWQNRPADIDKLLVRTGYGELIPLAAVTQINGAEKSSSPSRARCASAPSTSTPTCPRASRSTRRWPSRATRRRTSAAARLSLTEIGTSKDVIDTFDQLHYHLRAGAARFRTWCWRCSSTASFIRSPSWSRCRSPSRARSFRCSSRTSRSISTA